MVRGERSGGRKGVVVEGKHTQYRPDGKISGARHCQPAGAYRRAVETDGYHGLLRGTGSDKGVLTE